MPNGGWKHFVGETFNVSEVFVQHYLTRFRAPFGFGIKSKIKFGTAFALGSAQPSVF
jgi:hypothetical protein